MGTHTSEEVIPFSLSVLDFYYTDTDVSNLFTLEIQEPSSDEEDND